jgi:peptide/nickel transport system substrate-binding protein
MFFVLVLGIQQGITLVPTHQASVSEGIGSDSKEMSTGTPAEYDSQRTIVWETPFDTYSLDPHRNYDYTGSWISDNVYETLFTYSFDTSESDTLIPLLAESLSISEDGLDYTFTLRQDVTFHDGTQFDAEAVKYNIERVFALFDAPAWMVAEGILGGESVQQAVRIYGRGSQAHVDAYYEWVALEPVTVLNPYTVRIRLARPYAPFLAALSYKVGSMVSPTWIENHGGVDIGVDNPYVDIHTCGTGPYMVEEWFPTAHIVLARNPGYWRAPYALESNPDAGSIDTVIVRINGDNEDRKLNLLIGESDGCDWPVEDVNEIWDSQTETPIYPDINVRTGEHDFTLWPLGFNLREYMLVDEVETPNPFHDKHLRKACSHAFDYATFGDVFNALGTQAQGPIPIGMFAHDDGLFTYSYDIDAAVTEWNLAIDNGLGDVLAALDYEIVIYAQNVGSRNSIIRMEQLLLLKNGIEAILDSPDAEKPFDNLEITIIEVPWSEYVDRLFSGSLLAFSCGWAVDFGDPHNFMWAYVDSRTREYEFPVTFSPRALLVGLGESEGWNTAQAETWIDEASSSADLDTRILAYQMIQEAVVEHAAYVWCFQPYHLNVERAGVHGFVFNPMRRGWSYFYNYWKEAVEPHTSFWWKNEFKALSGAGQSTYSEVYLQKLVDEVASASSMFAGVTTVAQALSVLSVENTPGAIGLALRELYAAWLNVANGAFNEDTPVYLNKLASAANVGNAIAECEAIVADTSSSIRELIRATRICQELNAGRY